MLRLLYFVLVASLTAFAASASADDSSAATAAAHRLEAGLIAPCCWRETLDIHQSPIADQLRREIQQRLAAGESVEKVEADLVARYGPKLRATLPGSLGYFLFGVFVISGLTVLVGLGIHLRRKARVKAPASTNHEEPPPPLAARERQKYEDKLDDDLDAERL